MKDKSLQVTINIYSILYHIEESNIEIIHELQIYPIPFFGHLKIKSTKLMQVTPHVFSSQLPKNIR